jgi:hypothetical protein
VYAQENGAAVASIVLLGSTVALAYNAVHNMLLKRTSSVAVRYTIFCLAAELEAHYSHVCIPILSHPFIGAKTLSVNPFQPCQGILNLCIYVEYHIQLLLCESVLATDVGDCAGRG